jgi:hypothetical protein
MEMMSNNPSLMKMAAGALRPVRDGQEITGWDMCFAHCREGCFAYCYFASPEKMKNMTPRELENLAKMQQAAAAPPASGTVPLHVGYGCRGEFFKRHFANNCISYRCCGIGNSLGQVYQPIGLMRYTSMREVTSGQTSSAWRAPWFSTDRGAGSRRWRVSLTVLCFAAAAGNSHGSPSVPGVPNFSADQMRAASQQLLNMSPDQLRQQVSMRRRRELVHAGSELGGFCLYTMEQARSIALRLISFFFFSGPQAQMMRSMPLATLRSLNPSFANLTDDQIKMSIEQMEMMASNPDMLRMAAQMAGNMSPEELQQAQVCRNRSRMRGKRSIWDETRLFLPPPFFAKGT